MSEADAREARYQAAGLDVYLFELPNTKVIDGTIRGNISRFVNHSCSPNCDARVSEDQQRIEIVSIGDIKKGEELTIDYRLKEGIPIPCLCKATNCRKYL